MFSFWDTPLGQQMMGLPPGKPPLWRPIYNVGTEVIVGNDGGSKSYPINSQYLLSKESAYYLASVYGAKVTEKPFEGNGGPVSSPVIEYFLNWTTFDQFGKPVNVEMNSGFLAYYYCPADSEPAPGAVYNPDIVVAECNAAIQAAKMDALRKVR